ncbi:MAG TPA: shikimate dehydrogenase [Blastocatellia bacterium]|nr:shikimate dehydrogenase [Blastocatellia bacterium]
MISTSSLICVPVIEAEANAFLDSMDEAERIADAIELRLDYLPADALPQLIAELSSRIAHVSKPLILTFRPREQGGKRDLTLQDRRDFWLGLPPEIINSTAYTDFEFDLVESFAGGQPPAPWEKVICSWHDFAETPHDLIARYDLMASSPAAVVKIATQAKCISDCHRIFELIDHAKGKKPVIALAMGLPGMMTRALALSRGGMLTFGALRRGAESAVGQPTAAELRDLYRVKQLSRNSEIFGVIGNPVSHSRSPLMHNAALKALNRGGVYLPFEVDDVGSFVVDFVHPKTRKMDWNLRGLSVTIPQKVAVIPYLDFIDATASAIGAVNTVVVEGDALYGYNTDVTGAMKPLDERIDVHGARVAVLGAGGSARAICYGLSQRDAAVTIYARDFKKAQPLADEFRTRIASIDSFNGEEDVVINCSPIGMRGHSEGRSLIKAESLIGVKLVYDLVYTPEETALLRDAKQAGCRTLGGLAMLVGQAAEQFQLWTGLEAPVDVMWRAVRSA